MKKFTYILSAAGLAAILFAGCYTQLTTRDRDYSDSGSQEAYGENQEYAQQGRDTYEDSSENYAGGYYDSTGYYDDSDYDYSYGSSNSPYYYDDFYYSYPSYRRYFWSYQPSIVIGFSWPGWYYDPFYSPFYYSYWYSWYPGSWCCLPYYYYYPSSWYFGYNNYYYGWYPHYTHYYSTTRERTRGMTRIRNLGGGRTSVGRGDLISSRDRNSGRSITERTREDAGISPAKRSRIPARVESGRDVKVTRSGRESVKTSRNTDRQTLRRPAERSTIRQEGKTGRTSTGRVVPDNRNGRTPSVEQRNEGRKSNGNIRPRSYTPPRKNYNPPSRTNPPKRYVPPKRQNTPKSYTPPKRNNTPKSYTPPKRNNTPRSYTPPKRNSTPRSYTPPSRSYTPPQRSSTPPSRSSGSRSGGSSSGRSRR